MANVRRYAKTSSTNAGNDLEFWLMRWLTCHTQLPKVLNAGYLITRCAIIFGDLCLNDDLRQVYRPAYWRS